MSVWTLAPGGGRLARLAIGVLAFQGAWFACVAGAAHGHAAAGVAAVAIVVALQVTWSDRRSTDVALIAIAVVLGLAWDSALAAAGVVEYASPGPLSGWAPAWILALWALFASMLREPLRWLHGRPWTAAVLGGVGGALSYGAAARIGACRFVDSAVAWPVLVLGWAVMTPLLLELARRFEHAPAPRRGRVR
jgi:hypothetical protein